MGFFDRFKRQHEQPKAKKPRHVVRETKGETDKAAYQNVPAADKAGKVVSNKPTDNKASIDDVSRDRVTKTARPEARLLLRPLVTEKASRLTADRQYAFAVHPTANKLLVKRAVESVYGIRPVTVSILRVKGKSVRYGRATGRTRTWKKAVITLPPGKTIGVYET